MRISWDKVGERLYETGVDHGVLYLNDGAGNYDEGYAWNGLTSVAESPSGAEPTALYADNIKYLNLMSAEEFGATIGAYTYPDEFGQCDGTAELAPGILVGQQTRKLFGLSYRTRIGNDVAGTDHGYKLHLVYGAQASPSEKSYETINDSPAAAEFSWEITTSPIEIPGLKPSATITIDSTKVSSADLTALENLLYGTPGTEPRLPSPAELVGIFGGTQIQAEATEPAYNATTKTITIPTVTGVDYLINDEIVAAGPVVITEDTVVTARPKAGYVFPEVTDEDWFYNF